MFLKRTTCSATTACNRRTPAASAHQMSEKQFSAKKQAARGFFSPKGCPETGGLFFFHPVAVTAFFVNSESIKSICLIKNTPQWRENAV
jgi:UDP-N-acetylmuramyl pentapeptide phosphotransferase/UDP-N-acetylglucosamine-1-phosphate transferase